MCASVRPMFGHTLGCADNYERDEAVDVGYCQFPQDSVKPVLRFPLQTKLHELQICELLRLLAVHFDAN